MSRFIPGFAALALAAPAADQSPTPLDRLVLEGLSANLSITAERLGARQAEAGVAAARAARMPNLIFEARYSERSGATTDIGRLLNPALDALNQLLGESRFPTDVGLALPLRQTTGFRVTQPIYQPAIGASHDRARALAAGQQARLGQRRRMVATAIQVSYLDYLKAIRVAELLDTTRLLVDENLRVNERLLTSGTSTPDAVLRATAEREAVIQQQAEAARLVAAARRAVNLLINRPLETPLEAFPDSTLGLDLTTPLVQAVAAAAAGREELALLDAGVSAAQAGSRVAGAARRPSLGAAVDYGIQGDQYRVGGSHDYLLASVVLQWSLFTGGRDRARQREASLEADRLTTLRDEARLQIEQQVRTSYEAAQVGRQSIVTAAARMVAARRGYQLMARRYAEGAASQVEYLDARNARTAAELNLIVTRYDYYQRCAELEGVAALRTWAPPETGASP